MGVNTSVSAGRGVVGEVRNEVMRSKAQFSVFDGRLECGRVTEAAGQSFISIFDQDGHLIADIWVRHENGHSDPTVGLAYANLFAAAPEMYELLKAIDLLENNWWCLKCNRVVKEEEVTFDEFHKNCDTYLGHNYVFNELLKKTKKVLAKAEGREVE